MACVPVTWLQNPGCCEMSARKQLYLQEAFKFENWIQAMYQIYCISCNAV